MRYFVFDRPVGYSTGTVYNKMSGGQERGFLVILKIHVYSDNTDSCACRATAFGFTTICSVQLALFASFVPTKWVVV